MDRAAVRQDAPLLDLRDVGALVDPDAAALDEVAATQADFAAFIESLSDEQIKAKDAEKVIADVDDGLLVQQMQGLHSGVNPISGDFSTGAAGLLITNGTVGAPVREITIASTLQRMLLDIVEVGGDLEWLPMRSAGMSLVIRDVTMSGA